MSAPHSPSDVDPVAALDALVRRRFACRRFLDRPVPRALLDELLDAARCAPSSSNIQPWHVYAVAGAHRGAISEALVRAHYEAADAHVPEQAVSIPMPDLHLSRRQDFGRLFYGSLNIQQSDKAARSAATARNYTFFDAPVGLIVTTDRRLGMASWVDVGMFLQTLMLAACARGLDTCPQETFAKYHVILRDMLAIPPEQMVVCGVSIGYGQDEWIRTRPRMPKAPIDEFTQYFGFDQGNDA